MRKRDLESLVSEMRQTICEQQRTIDDLRAKLCRDGHDWVEVGRRKIPDPYDWMGLPNPPVYSVESICVRCGKRRCQ